MKGEREREICEKRKKNGDLKHEMKKCDFLLSLSAVRKQEEKAL